MKLSELSRKGREYIFIKLVKAGFFNTWDDERFIKMQYKRSFGVEPDLENPKTFNEKLNWLKLHDRKPEYIRMADKYEAKKIVAEKIGEQHVIPTYGVWDSAEEIDFDTLPEQFVLKTTHDCGGVLICRDKATFDREKAKRFLARRLKRNYYWPNREWPYKDIKPRILAEKFLVDESGYELKDYKFFCFDGVVRAMFVATDRGVEGRETKFDFFDADFNHLPIKNGHENADKEIKRPPAFEEMKELAAKLSKGIAHVRVDFYDVNGAVYFGELTFSHWGGFRAFEPEEWDERITLPE